MITSCKYDVAKIDWLKRVTDLKNLAKIQEFYPWELYSRSPSTQKRLEKIYDEFWDSYVDDIDEESLKRVIDKVEEYVRYLLTFHIEMLLQSLFQLFKIAVGNQ